MHVFVSNNLIKFIFITFVHCYCSLFFKILISFWFSICFLIVSISFFLMQFFFRHEINPIDLVNATNHQSKQIFSNFLFNLPLSSSSHSWNVTNHFSNQNSTHPEHSNIQLNYLFFNHTNVNVTNLNGDQIIHFKKEFRNRYFNQDAIINQNGYQGIINHALQFIAYFDTEYCHAVSYVIIGITFYILVFYLLVN